MILRVWRARADVSRRHHYPEYFREHVAPGLSRIEGFLGADVVEREAGTVVEFTVITRWASMDAIRRFAGADPERAVVEPGAAAVLREYDDAVSHHGLVVLVD
jgi:heme-degrading monooxygenase HmoA